MSQSDDLLTDGPPLHGFQGDREPETGPAPFPEAPSIAISREVGARGTDIARRLASRLGWSVYDSELLGYSSQDAATLDTLLAELPRPATEWVDAQMQRLRQRGLLAIDPSYERVSRLILILGVKGEAIFVGRGAGFLLPRATTLHVRLTAPLTNRIAYMSQSLRLPQDEAAELVTTRESKRAEFLARCFSLPEAGIPYDLTLDCSTLGEELCAELIERAVQCKRSRSITSFV